MTAINKPIQPALPGAAKALGEKPVAGQAREHWGPASSEQVQRGPWDVLWDGAEVLGP